MLDTGGYGSMIDLKTAEALKLDVTKAVNANYGHYYSPGYRPVPFAGMVHGPIQIRFSGEVVLTIPHLRVINSNRCIVLLGVDLLCGGRPTERWNFASTSIATATDSAISGTISFKLG
jgi:hypothetical protein